MLLVKLSIYDASPTTLYNVQTSQDNIDLGEAEAIILALELKADLLLMGDRRGRALAFCYDYAGIVL